MKSTSSGSVSTTKLASYGDRRFQKTPSLLCNSLRSDMRTSMAVQTLRSSSKTSWLCTAPLSRLWLCALYKFSTIIIIIETLRSNNTVNLVEPRTRINWTDHSERLQQSKENIYRLLYTLWAKCWNHRPHSEEWSDCDYFNTTAF